MSCICLLLAFVSCSSSPSAPQVPGTVETAHLREIYHLLHGYMLAGDSFPGSFADLRPEYVKDPTIFLSTASNIVPGTLATIEEWTDFIYIGGMSLGTPMAALVISPPENHQGKYGYVLFDGGKISRLSAAETRALILDPLHEETISPVTNVALIRQVMTVRVPKKLRQYYDR